VAVRGYRKPVTLNEIPRNRHAVIEASAGTGKTYAIEYLVLDLLLNTTCSIEEILVVTFTERATVDLHARMRNLIESVLLPTASAEDEVARDFVRIDETGKGRLEAALFAFDRAPIFTIHAFCRRILTDMAFDTGAAFGLAVVDSHRAFHRAFRGELREFIAVDPSARRLLDEWMADGETAGHFNLVDSLEALLREAHFNRYLQAGAREQNQHAIAQLADLYNEALLKRSGIGRNAKVSSNSLKAAEQLTRILREGAYSPGQLYTALSGFKFDSLRAVTAHDSKERRLVDAMEAARVASSLESRVVDTFLPLVELRLRDEKRQNNEIDYADMLEQVWEALESARASALLGSLRARFRYGLVDEFQDTDDLQWKIFQRIFLESEAANILYVVGDPKQAIYAFRGADVFTYLDARREILESHGSSVTLVDNYRSSADLIEGLNRILDQRASPALFSGEIRYDRPVRCGRRDLRASRANGKSFVPVTLLEYCPANPPVGVAKMRASVGSWIASEIHRILFDPDSAVTVTEESHKSRRVEAKDIFVLTRSGAEAGEIGGYLREQGVPFAFYKKDGLFRTGEAYDVLDILTAIEEPDSRSKCLRAWITPFFAVAYEELFDCGDLSADQALNERLYEWKALSDREQFGELFDQLVHRSGLVGRELFLSNNERELTNYLHIFETLLEQILADGLSLREVIGRLESFIAETALPAGIESNIQRIESERSAVQIMSVHMSKGLQADIVFLFGGTVHPPMPPRVAVYHNHGHARRMAIGKDGRDFAKDSLQREAREENERLAYVALTRARVKLYLPVYPLGCTKRPVNGYYEALNNRLQVLAEEVNREEAPSGLFQTIAVRDVNYATDRSSAKLPERIASWLPPKPLLNLVEAGKPERFFAELWIRSRPMQTRSYTTLGGRASRVSQAYDIELDEFKYDLDAPAEVNDLRGGRQVGIFLHEAIEKLDLERFAGEDLDAWRDDNAVKSVFADAMRRHQVSDARWLDRGTEIVFNALTSRIATRPKASIGPLYKCRSIREMEFVYPIPERLHRLLESSQDGRWSVDRGYLKGFVDFIFEDAGLYYFADWKSDSLSSYDGDAVALHVNQHYDLQARIYSVGIVRLLGIRDKVDYDRRFGGMLYLFIRGMRRDGAGDQGVYFRRPSWAEICAYERDLIGAVPGVQP
jgi:exodeoxyribonuclease V beta subunit